MGAVLFPGRTTDLRWHTPFSARHPDRCGCSAANGVLRCTSRARRWLRARRARCSAQCPASSASRAQCKPCSRRHTSFSPPHPDRCGCCAANGVLRGRAGAPLAAGAARTPRWAVFRVTSIPRSARPCSRRHTSFSAPHPDQCGCCTANGVLRGRAGAPLAAGAARTPCWAVFRVTSIPRSANRVLGVTPRSRHNTPTDPGVVRRTGCCAARGPRGRCNAARVGGRAARARRAGVGRAGRTGRARAAQRRARWRPAHAGRAGAGRAARGARGARVGAARGARAGAAPGQHDAPGRREARPGGAGCSWGA
ncbi:hypothetical protein FHR78_001925 [Frigoribacterium faeni]|nr:hypothetical protein [Frigoribacterium faeni]